MGYVSTYSEIIEQIQYDRAFPMKALHIRKVFRGTELLEGRQCFYTWSHFIWFLNSIDNACGSISCVCKCPATWGAMGTVWFLCHAVKASAILIGIIGFEEPILASLEPYLYQHRQRFILESRMPGRDFLYLKMVCCLLLPGSGTAVVLGTVCIIMSCLCLVCRSAQVLHLEEKKKKSKMEKNFLWLWEGGSSYF